ncbi:MAG TPA: hypothetical protein VN040_25790 [Pseudosphingobacterium sp.]|nr:hypothetical protein [Pseudosphingobacterium sp.]
MALKQLIEDNKDDIAIIVGNGINRYLEQKGGFSWDDLLIDLWKTFNPGVYSKMPEGITVTEFYDLLDLSKSNQSIADYSIQKQAAKLLDQWNYLDHHRRFVSKLAELNIPVLTTNFDLLLPRSLNLKQRFLNSGEGFTDYYPWKTYFGNSVLESPTSGFGIWYINGITQYPRSIRLGLSQYMGSVEKARAYLHKGKGRLFNIKNKGNWNGQQTWLDIVFKKSLCIIGLGLNENEVFLRWLLIERARYFKQFKEHTKKGWYISTKVEDPDSRTLGKTIFLKSMGIDLIEEVDYKAIYESPWL